MDFYCFLNFFTTKLYHFPHKKWVALKRASSCDVAALTFHKQENK